MQIRKPASKPTKQQAKRPKPTNVSSSESADSSSDDELDEPVAKKPKKGTVVRKIKDIAPEDKLIAETITQLRQFWRCNDKSCKNGTGFCWVNSDDGSHIPLGHTHFSVWASAIIKDDGTATLQKPPNNHLFDSINADKKGSISPLLQARINANMKAKELTSVPAQPSFVVQMPPMPQYPYPPFAPPPNGLVQQMESRAEAPAAEECLIPTNLQPGLDMSIAEFCTMYQLDDELLKRFSDEGYRTTSSFQHIVIPDLLQAKFRRGDIAELKSAVSKWAKHHA